MKIIEWLKSLFRRDDSDYIDLEDVIDEDTLAAILGSNNGD
jgi:hypothetical protein